MNFKNKIQNLILSINTKTGQSDETLTDAIQTLIDNSGGGESLPLLNNPVTANKIIEGYEAYNANKEKIVGIIPIVSTGETYVVHGITNVSVAIELENMFE